MPGFKHGIHKAVKNNPLTEQKAWERGWSGDFARGWERWARTGNVYPETLGRVLFQKNYVGSEGQRARETLSLSRMKGPKCGTGREQAAGADGFSQDQLCHFSVLNASLAD